MIIKKIKEVFSTNKKTMPSWLLSVLASLPLGGLGWAFTSCSDFFETDSDRQIFDPALDQKTDSMFYTLGILKGVQMIADQYVMTGEMRGDLVMTNQYTETDLRDLASFTATAANKFDSAYAYYRIINNCNYYIAHRDTTLRTGSVRVAIPEYAEALAVRAWTYMQLCKNYGDVPFYTDPLVSIGDANRTLEKKDLKYIVDALTPELIQYSGLTVDGGTPVPNYGEISVGELNGSEGETPQIKKVQSRYAMMPVDVVLGDLFLETHQYDKAAKHYAQYLIDNRVQTGSYYANPSSTMMQQFEDIMPSDFVYTSYSPSWRDIFGGNSTHDIITYIPLATNRLRGVVTDLPRYFGYDFYSTNSGDVNSNQRYLSERQIDASPAYIALSNAQDYYYRPASSSAAGTVVRSVPTGDWRRYTTMQQVVPSTREDSIFNVMIKFNSANVPIYRVSTVYLRLAEALNRMGHPDGAFAILKDGINTDLLDYEQRGDSTDLDFGRYITRETAELLQTTIPFLSTENIQKFDNNRGIHSRGCNYTQERFSPYSYTSIVGKKLSELTAEYGLNPETFTMQDTINAMEDIICDEMALELAFEGNRFGDLTRMARHKNEAGLYSSTFGSEWLARKLDYKNPAVSLRDEKNWYLPMK